MKKNNIFNNPVFISSVLTIIVLVISLQSYLQKPRVNELTGKEFTHYNNFMIFKTSYFHLIDNKDLYQLHPNDHGDYFKYSPAFSLLMAPIALMPTSLGLFAWNLLNVALSFWALWQLQFQTDKKRLLMFVLIFIEMATSIQNAQSNGLMVGLFVAAFVFLERKNIAIASMLIVLTIFIKPFGLLALVLFLFYPNKLKTAIYTISWFVLFTFLPLLAVSFSQLSLLYNSWFHLLKIDQTQSIGMSVSGIVNSWFGIKADKIVFILGTIMFCLPLIKHKFYSDIKFRMLFLSSILIWVVIFNYKAESPTFVIAITGVAIWYLTQKGTLTNNILIILALILTVLSPTDIFPIYLREKLILPYNLKALPCILIWIKITIDLLNFQDEKSLLIADNV